MSKRKPMRELLDLGELKPDAANRRDHTKRNIDMLRDSLMKVGAARSIVIDEHNEILAGNGVVEAAGEVGINRVHVVEADGKTLIAVRRTGLSATEKYALSIADNRAAELAAWNPERLRVDREAGLELQPFFTDEELKKILKDRREPPVKEIDTGEVLDKFWISIRGPLKYQAIVLQKLREATKDLAVEVEQGNTQVEQWTG